MELTDALRRRLAKEQRGLCFYCALRLHDDMTWEHLVARAHGGRNRLSNLKVSHARCNSLVGVLDIDRKFALHEVGRLLGSDAFFLLAARLKPLTNVQTRQGAGTMHIRRRPKRLPPELHRAVVERLLLQLPPALAA